MAVCIDPKMDCSSSNNSGVDWRMGKLTSCSGVVGGGISMRMCGGISRYQSKSARKKVTQSKLSINDAMKL